MSASPGRLLVRRPGPLLDQGLVTHLSRQPVDLVAAARQWESYVEVFRASGWDIIEVAPADDCADAVFVEDTMVAFDELVLMARPGALSRRPEIDSAFDAAAAAGLTTLRIADPGTLDGGDVLKVGRTVFVGRSARTNDAGIEQLQQILEARCWNVVPVPLTKALHLKSAVTALPDGTIIGWLPALEDGVSFAEVLAMPEESGAHVVDIGGGALLMAGDCPDSVELVRSRGFSVTTVDISEFAKLEGCVTCLSVRLRAR